MTYRVLSPDGFDIKQDEEYKTLKDAHCALHEWVQCFNHQGYYSQICYNGYKRQIPLEDLPDYCEIVKN